MREISPSVLSLDFTNLSKYIKLTNEAGINRIHLDVMDGHFVPNLTFGPMIIKYIRELTTSHLETHLMIDNPYKSFDQYIEAGSDTIIFHYESSDSIERDLIYLKNNNVKCGLAIKPETNYNAVEPFLDMLDYILVMSVNPGFGGQGFIESSISKMELIHKMCLDKNCRNKIKIGVDGGVNLNTINKVYATGIDIAIVGSGFYNAKDLNKRHMELLNA